VCGEAGQVGFGKRNLAEARAVAVTPDEGRKGSCATKVRLVPWNATILRVRARLLHYGC